MTEDGRKFKAALAAVVSHFENQGHSIHDATAALIEAFGFAANVSSYCQIWCSAIVMRRRDLGLMV